MPRNENARPDKSNFTRRCALLSRYLKEKGSFGNIDLGLVLKPDSDLGSPGNSDPPGKQKVMRMADLETKAPDFIQRISKDGLSTSSGGNPKYTILSESEAGSSQLSIFFGGKVLVYNEFPADKAKEIMEVAKQAKPVNEINIHTPNNVENNTININMVLPDLNEPTNHNHHTIQQQQQQQQNQLVERIACRASLHRFFSKRKERAMARAPYQVNQNAGHHHHLTKPEIVAGQPLEQGQSSQRPDNAVAQILSHPKPEGDKEILMEVEEEGQSSKDLELRLQLSLLNNF